jgi:hypothetical protein
MVKGVRRRRSGWHFPFVAKGRKGNRSHCRGRWKPSRRGVFGIGRHDIKLACRGWNLRKLCSSPYVARRMEAKEDEGVTGLQRRLRLLGPDRWWKRARAAR